MGLDVLGARLGRHTLPPHNYTTLLTACLLGKAPRKNLCGRLYNLTMQNANTLQKLTDKLWDEYCEIFPALVRFDSPIIKINNRFTKCAGCNISQDNIIQMAGKFLVQFESNMVRVILPHEIAHQIDFNLNGWYDRKPHHGREWQIIMAKIGQPANPYHNMVLK